MLADSCLCGGACVGLLVRVRSDPDHVARPFVWFCCQRADRWPTDLTGGDATLLSSQAGDPRAAASDTTRWWSDLRVDSQTRSQLAAVPRTNRPGRTSPSTVTATMTVSQTNNARARRCSAPCRAEEQREEPISDAGVSSKRGARRAA